MGGLLFLFKIYKQSFSLICQQKILCADSKAPVSLEHNFFWHKIVDLKVINNRMYYFPQVRGFEGRAGMAAIVDLDDSLNLMTLAEGLKKSLPSYARPMFIRIVRKVDMTGKQEF
jgi:hypothetical protein